MSGLITPSAPARTRCAKCGRAIDCSAADLRAYAASGPPRCCGEAMTLPITHRPAGRVGGQRPPRAGVRVDVRRPGPERGDDLGRGVSNLGADAAVIRLSAAVVAGNELDVILLRPDGRPLPPVRGIAKWCRPLGGGLFAAGLGFNRRLGLAEMADLV